MHTTISRSLKHRVVSRWGKFGLEEEIERIKRGKNVLMQELVRLRQQQQQATDQQFKHLGSALST